MDRKELLHKLQEKGFAVVEANLYLDAYSDCAQALAYFREAVHDYEQTVKEYEAACGPLTAAADTGNSWDWVSTPWPWEMGVN